LNFLVKILIQFFKQYLNRRKIKLQLMWQKAFSSIVPFYCFALQ